MATKDRIKELRRVKASDLIPNTENWRKHPKTQRNALADMLEKIGYADALIARETENGLELIDGHLRAETTPEDIVPVLVLDVDENEAKQLLATMDPLSAMAQPDQDSLIKLLDVVNIESNPVNDMLEALMNGETSPMPNWGDITTNPTQEDIDAHTDELGSAFENTDPDKGMIALICPECMHEYNINKSDLDNEFGRDS